MHLRIGAPDRRRTTRDGLRGEPERSELVARILGTYNEMPGLMLRLEQAARLFGLCLRTCEVVLGDLVDQRQLRRDERGQYCAG